MNIFVGNLAREVTEADLKTEFEVFGAVSSVSLVKDKYSGQSRGFAFVEMPNKEEGEAAIAALKGKKFKERTMDISEAMPRDNRGRSGGRPGGGFQGKRRPPRRR